MFILINLFLLNVAVDSSTRRGDEGMDKLMENLFKVYHSLPTPIAHTLTTALENYIIAKVYLNNFYFFIAMLINNEANGRVYITRAKPKSKPLGLPLNLRGSGLINGFTSISLLFANSFLCFYSTKS